MKKYEVEHDDLIDVLALVFEKNTSELGDVALINLAKKEIQKREKEFNEVWEYDKKMLLKTIREEREEKIKEEYCDQHGHQLQYETEDENCNTLICTRCRYFEDVVSVNSRGY